MTDSRKRAGGAAGNDRVLARGRSSRSNASGRFEAVQAEKFDDGWGEHEAEESRAGDDADGRPSEDHPVTQRQPRYRL